MKFSKAAQTRRQWVEVDGKSKWQGEESDLQKQCEQFLEYCPDIAVIRFPDAAYRAIFGFGSNLPDWIKKLIASYVKGIPDLTLLKNKADGTVAALPVELKKDDGKLSQGQKKFAGIVTVYVIRDFESFVEMVEDFRKKCGV